MMRCGGQDLNLASSTLWPWKAAVIFELADCKIMKRKRNAKRKPKKTTVVGANEAFFNADHSSIDDLYNAVVSRMEAETPQAGTSKSIQQSGLGKQVFNEITENNSNTLAEMKIALTSNLSKKAGSLTTKLSRGFASSNMNLTSNAGLVQGKRTCQTESKIPHQDPRYKKQELNTALLVITKIMQMDAAEVFNVPVDPIALGIPDYFDVIDTPMDFGTICNNLEKGHKYMNSEDVFKDVQYIWENCCKYNKKGDCILEVMKLMKKNFMKYWTAAGLYKEQPLATNGATLVYSVPN
ncbi:unnamed protein product [Ilex paraguariensis]|uniref:Bromo domain-containing protein n=1 Tax=Ilex paraguariensis TaxID=185542 RepID=A0ABC8T7M7_9AQUA